MLAQQHPQLRLLARLAFLVMLWLCATAAYAQGGSISGQVVSPAGYPVAYGSVRICPTTSTGNPCTPLASNLYADPQLTQPVANPYTTDGFGNYSVFVPPATYYIVQVSFTSNQQAYSYAYLVSAASNAVATAALQYSIATYTAPGTATTVGQSFTGGNGQLRTDAAAGLYVPGPAIFYGTLNGTSITGTTINATTGYQVAGVPLAAANLSNGVTGSGQIVLANTPTLITPILGVATATSLNTSGNIVDGGTLAVTGNATAPIFNAGTGYQIAGAAPLNHVLVGNGTTYVDSATVPSAAIPNLYYQTMQANTTAQTQRTALNFSTAFTLTDSASPSRTTVDLASTVAAGGCSNCTLTYDAKGRIVAASTGATGLTVLASTEFSSCMLAPDGGSIWDCAGTGSWGTTLANNTYKLLCTISQGTAGYNSTNTITFFWTSKSTTGFSYAMTGDHSGANGSQSTVDCIATQ